MKNFSNYRHIMLDMETLSVEDNPVVISISAVAFDVDIMNSVDDFKRPKDGQIRDDISFHCALEINDQIKKGLDFDSATLLWHLTYNKDFFMKCIGEKDSPIRIIKPEVALEEFNNYLRTVMSKERYYRQPMVWACGAINDHRWLDSLFSAYHIKNITDFRHKMCYRTIREGFQDIRSERVNNHDSFDDCVNQILTFQEIFKNAIDS